MEMLRSHWTIAYKNNKHIRVCLSALARESCGNVQEALCWWVYECACRCVGAYMNKRGWERLRRTYGGWWRPNNMHKATRNFDEMKRCAWNRIDLALHRKEEIKKLSVVDRAGTMFISSTSHVLARMGCAWWADRTEWSAYCISHRPHGLHTSSDKAAASQSAIRGNETSLMSHDGRKNFIPLRQGDRGFSMHIYSALGGNRPEQKSVEKKKNKDFVLMLYTCSTLFFTELTWQT